MAGRRQHLPSFSLLAEGDLLPSVPTRGRLLLVVAAVSVPSAAWAQAGEYSGNKAGT